MSRIVVKITKCKVDAVKKNLAAGIRAASRLSGVSYYTAWCISKGKYDVDSPLQATVNQRICPITGFKLRKQNHLI